MLRHGVVLGADFVGYSSQPSAEQLRLAEVARHRFGEVLAVLRDGGAHAVYAHAGDGGYVGVFGVGFRDPRGRRGYATNVAE